MLFLAAPEPVTPLIPPVGLKATVLSSTTILLSWSDSTLPGRGQHVTDNRYYTVRYMPKMLQTKNKYRMVNATSLSQHIEDLKPDTEYEFNVKVTKGPRLSTWSLSVFNKTKEAGRYTQMFLYFLTHVSDFVFLALHSHFCANVPLNPHSLIQISII